jgi:hypothetical protein
LAQLKFQTKNNLLWCDRDGIEGLLASVAALGIVLVVLVAGLPGNGAEVSAWSIIVAKTLTLKNISVLTIDNEYSGLGATGPKGAGPLNMAPNLSH